MDEQENQEATLEELQQQLDEAKTEAANNKNNWMRTAADFENYQKRKESESQELVIFAREVAITKLLPTLDSLEQAIRHRPEVSDESQVTSDKFVAKYQVWQAGLDGLVKQLDKALEELGVRKIDSVGKKFDPNFHEAVREVEGEEDGLVVEELQSGFELNGRVIRPSQVVISKKSG